MAVLAVPCETTAEAVTPGASLIAASAADAFVVSAEPAAAVDSLRFGAVSAPFVFLRFRSLDSIAFGSPPPPAPAFLRGAAVVLSSSDADFATTFALVAALPTVGAGAADLPPFLEEAAEFMLDDSPFAPALGDGAARVALEAALGARSVFLFDRFGPPRSGAFDTFFVTFLRAAIGEVSKNARRAKPALP